MLNILKRLFSSPPPPASTITVRCNRCGEIITSRLNLSNDLSPEYDQAGGLTYFCHKTLMGDGHCFQRIEVDMTFDRTYRLLECRVQGGQRLDPPSP